MESDNHGVFHCPCPSSYAWLAGPPALRGSFAERELVLFDNLTVTASTSTRPSTLQSFSYIVPELLLLTLHSKSFRFYFIRESVLLNQIKHRRFQYLISEIEIV